MRGAGLPQLSREANAREPGPSPIRKGFSGESMLNCSFWPRPAGVWAFGGVAALSL